MEERVLALIRKKQQWTALSLTVALLFYFLLPLSLIFIPDVMKRSSFVFGIPWAWVYAFLQFPLTWFFVWFYHRKAKKLEQKVREIKGEEQL